MDRQQARGQVRSQPGSLARGMSERGRILGQAQRGVRVAFDVKNIEWKMTPLDGGHSVKEPWRMWTYISHLIMTNKLSF